MIEVNAIRNDEQLDTAMTRLEEIFFAQPGTPEEEELEILTTLIQKYEAEHYPIHASEPDPIAAIKFRMDQQNLTASDLEPMIGNRSKVNEVLSGRRPITIDMARALHASLGIPADILLAPLPTPPLELADEDYKKFPITAMVKAGWFEVLPKAGKPKKVIDHLIDRAGGAQPTALLRQGNNPRMSAKTNPYALQAWLWQVAGTALENEPQGAYCPEDISQDFVREVGKLSRFPSGPAQARKMLAEYGIAMVYTPKLPKTYLDGAAFITSEGFPVVGLTLRYDRVDNFWFTLMHELAHVSLHLADEGSKDTYIDDLNIKTAAGTGYNAPKEHEADAFAEETLIPQERWDQLPNRGTTQVIALAQELDINPAIVAGRARHESGNYRLLSQLVGNGEVRKFLKPNR